MKKHLPLLTTLATIASITAAIAGGAFSQYPIVGIPDNTTCLSYGNGGVCNQYAPAGPAEDNGSSVIPTDTRSIANQGQQTVLTPLSTLGHNSRMNRLIGGDFSTNLWQRGTTPVSAATPSTTVIGADRWAVYSSGNTVTVTKQTAAADTIPSLGFYASQRVSRPSGTNATQICVGQVLDKLAAAPLVGNNAVFSFYALAGAGLSAVANNNITATIAYYTAADSATPLTNTDAFMKGTITGYTAVTAGGGIVQVIGRGSPNATNTASISAGVATVGISTTWTRYSVYGKIPTATAAGTAVTGVGVTLCYTPASGTGGSTEWFEFTGAQLQATSSTVTDALPAGVTAPSGFERRPAQQEEALQYYYTWRLNETNGAVYPGAVLCTATANAWIALQPPVAMRETPTVAVTAGGLSIRTAAAVTGIGTTTLLSGSTAQTLSLTSGAACTSTLPYQLVGTNTTGSFTFSAEP